MSNISCSVGNDADKYTSHEEDIGQLLCSLGEVSLGLNSSHAKTVLSTEMIMSKLTSTFAEAKEMLSKFAAKFKAYLLAKTPGRVNAISARRITRNARKFTPSSSAKAASGGDSDSDGEPYSHNQALYASSSVLSPQQISHYPCQRLQAETSNINSSILIFQCSSMFRLSILLCVAGLHILKLKIASTRLKTIALSNSVWVCVLNIKDSVLEGARNV